jgi:hypothetical protein
LGACALLLILNRSRALPRLEPSFALYGALHAAALAASQRLSQPIWRQFSFLASAALASALTLRFGLLLLQHAALLPAMFAPGVLLALSSFAGAVVYGLLIRAFRMHAFDARALAATSLLCALVTLSAFTIARRTGGSSSLWLAIPWWLSFSASLWYRDRNDA